MKRCRMRSQSVAALALLAALAAPAGGQQLPQKVWTLPSPFISLGYCQLTTISVATSLSSCPIPSAPAGTVGDVLAIVQPSAAANFRDDGTAPTASTGIALAANQVWQVTTNPLSNFQIIPQTGTITVNVIFYATR
jgi:hypothetical protein